MPSYTRFACAWIALFISLSASIGVRGLSRVACGDDCCPVNQFCCGFGCVDDKLAPTILCPAVADGCCTNPSEPTGCSPVDPGPVDPAPCDPKDCCPFGQFCCGGTCLDDSQQQFVKCRRDGCCKEKKSWNWKKGKRVQREKRTCGADCCPSGHFCCGGACKADSLKPVISCLADVGCCEKDDCCGPKEFCCGDGCLAEGTRTFAPCGESRCCSKSD